MVEAGHWILALREKCEHGKHKLYVLDSLGKNSGTRQRNDIANALARTPIFQNLPKGKAYDVQAQSENECGARVAKYMWDITQSYLNTRNRVNISQMIGTIIRLEKENGSHEAAKCRNGIQEKLEGEKRKRGIGI